MSGVRENTDEGCETLQYMRTHCSVDILNAIIALQLNPENRGANVRMELLARYAAMTIDVGEEPVVKSEWEMVLDKEFSEDHSEDHPINLHSETFVWVGGNHTIFPGIATNSSEILNQISAALFLTKESWPIGFMKKTYQAFSLLLSLGDMMAQKVHYIGFVKGKDRRRQTLDYSYNGTDFGITEAEMENLLINRGISHEILNEFVLDIQKERVALSNDDPDENPLLRKPIVKHEGKYYFLMVSNQADALRRYVLTEAVNAKCIGHLADVMYAYLREQIMDVFLHMLWMPTDIDIKGEPLPNSTEMVFQFDRNCYAYTCFVHESAADFQKGHLSFIDMTERLAYVERKLIEKVGHDKHMMSIVLYASLGETGGCSLSIEPQYPVLLWPAHAFVAVAKLEKWERFDLMHYAEAYSKVANHIFSTEPIDIYSLYRAKNHSFYLTDDAMPTWIMPEPNEGYDLIQDSKLAINYHAVARIHDGHEGFVAVVRESEDVPCYKPINEGDEYLRCIDNGAVPIWVCCKQNGICAKHAAVWGTTLLYWLYYINKHEDISSYLSQKPQEIELLFADTDMGYPYKFNKTAYGVRMTISGNGIESMMRPDNEEERSMIKACINALTNRDIGSEMVDKYIPVSEAKMVIGYSIDPLSTANPIGHLEPLLLTDATQQKIWDEIPMWMAENGFDFQGELTTKEDNVQALRHLVSVCLWKVKQLVIQYDYAYLLRMAVWHYDTLIWKREHDKVHNPAQIVCFGDDDERKEAIRKAELRLTRSGLGLRCLIEYLAAQPHEGVSKEIGDYELEYIASIMCEMASYGSVCDMVYFDMADMQIGHLPSGRYGINQDDFEDKLFAFHQEYNEVNIDGLVRDFTNVFRSNVSKSEPDYDAIKEENMAFEADWGVSFRDIGWVCLYMSEMCVKRKVSLLQMPEDDVVSELCEMSTLDELIIRKVIDRMALHARPSFLEAPEGYGSTEVYPWRYNREFSFLRRYIVKERDNTGVVYLTFGQRNAIAAFKQLTYLLVEGQLNVHEHDEHIKKLVGRYSEKKGAAFNEQVRNYLKEHTALMVIDYDVPIDKEHFASADKNYGDIDVLAFDRQSGTAYNIECKDTVMAKNIYQMYIEIRKFLGQNEKEKKGALVWKHYRRHEWLSQHKQELAQILKVDEVTEVKSILITSTVLPVAYLKRDALPLPIVSYRELMESGEDIELLFAK